ncbi:PP2C family protein-serine/threonine phosphatase [Colwellia psychrerythraea]|uniref:Protein serine/threonine phosphatase n=1 Tax=Colwellia psychrerythraea TaxID=28229 RepID=A0A099L293_COLPS|nr:protein phosphatase 2C domain-containing protein [Colwellia psychrerythraea]KGJ96267.1 protein serine/threonine phosphatase [Colwellia psychrerythraea]
MNYHIKSLCHQGAIRKNNEDAISYGIHKELDVAWMLIADGMGGHNAGEVASKMLVDHIKSEWHKVSITHQANWQTWISEQLNAANIAILSQARKTIDQQGMGTTGVLMVIENNNCHLGWIGDSRAYSLKYSNLVQETVDHTMLQELVNKGAISAETAKNSNTKNLLSQAIGVREKITVETKTIVLNSGDTVMLSTDGLHDYLTEQEICNYLSLFSDKKDVCHDMVSQAITQNSRDNLTVGLINLSN